MLLAEAYNIQSTVYISKSKGPSEKLRDIRTSTYQICSIEEKTIRQPNFTNDYVIEVELTRVDCTVKFRFLEY